MPEYHPLYAAIGWIIVLAVEVDVFMTTMGEAGGPFSKRFMARFYALLLPLLRGRHKALAIAGIVILLLTAAIWILSFWLGWTLIFMGAEYNLINAENKSPAGLWDRAYFAGYTLFTLGLGDFQPVGASWKLLTTVASLAGLFLVTFSITYLLPVVQANTHRRQLAVMISAMGQSTESILANAWDPDSGLEALGDHFNAMIPDVAQLEQQHLTYPALHYLHSIERYEASAPALAALDEALTVVEIGLRADAGLPTPVYLPLRRVINALLDTLEDAFIPPADTAPPPPALAALRARGIPVVDDESFRDALAAFEGRRKLLRGMVQHAGWDWSDVSRSHDTGSD